MSARPRLRSSFRLTGLWTLLAILAIPAGYAQNLTVGNDVGADHIAFTFAPYKFAFDNAESAYRDHVSAAPGMGQQYGYIEYVQSAAPGNAPPAATTVAQFYSLIRDNTTFLGTLLLTSHGGDNTVSIEPYAKTAAGLAARDARYDAYIAGTTGIAGLPKFKATEIYHSENHDAYAVGVTDEFIRAYGRLTQGLVYNTACHSGSLTDDFVAADARVALGNPGDILPATNVTNVTTFFTRMDGKQGQAKRPVAAAKAGLGLTTDGQENTTLAPSVLTLTAPCPIKAGDTVTYTFDTTCEMGIVPDITCSTCTIANEVWLDNKTLQGTCTAPPPPGVFVFTLTLPWVTTYSDQNVARLDGNTNPPPNAEGPAHDDYVKDYDCQMDSDGDGTFDGSDNCPDLPNPGQTNTDHDGQGDSCDSCPLDALNDSDLDGVCGNVDRCPFVADAGQADSDGDGLGDACDNCPAHSNPSQTPVIFAQTITAPNKFAFVWPTRTDVEYVMGPLSQLRNYAIANRAPLTGANTINTAAENPAPGVGLYYLVRLGGACRGSWQSFAGAEPGRDTGFATDEFGCSLCDDGNPCTIDTCDPTTAICTHASAPNGTPCSDNDECTAQDTCNGGVCQPGPISCPTTTFCSPNFINIPTSGAAVPYPSSIAVAEVGHAVKVTLNLNGLTHTFPDDLDVLLVGPTGVNALVVSDVGGGGDANSVGLLLDDAAATPLPDGTQLTSGTFKPANYDGAADNVPPPAPFPSGGSALSVFAGTNADGIWKLFVVDNAVGNPGMISGGWCLNITHR